MSRASVVLSVGFRPFFLGAGVAALMPVLAWVLALAGLAPAFAPDGIVAWHGHEMLFGYAVAVMAGFLCTAVRNWTGLPTVQDRALALLFALWLAGRVLPWLPVPRELVALVDFAFLPALAFIVARPILAVQQRQNLVFPGMLLGLAALNALSHAAVLTEDGWLATRVLTGAAMLAMVMISVMGGRIIPRFTENGIDTDFSARHWRGVEAAATPALAATALCVLVAPEGLLLSFCAMVAAALHGVRLAGWYTSAIWRVPLVWVLQVAYAWLVAGLLLLALSPPAIGVIGLLPSLHALTAGALGMVTLGMMARVSLGHTGRPIVAPGAIAVAFVLVALAAGVRVFGVLLLPAQYATMVALAGVLWSVAFVLFLVVYAPVLTAPRVR